MVDTSKVAGKEEEFGARKANLDGSLLLLQDRCRAYFINEELLETKANSLFLS